MTLITFLFSRNKDCFYFKSLSKITEINKILNFLVIIHYRVILIISIYTFNSLITLKFYKLLKEVNYYLKI